MARRNLKQEYLRRKYHRALVKRSHARAVLHVGKPGSAKRMYK